jgi:hypothetical protein
MPMATLSLFYSYSHRDESLRNKLATHLSVLQDEGIISGWHDRRITAGAEWDGVINQNLDEAGVILLLVSADFLASRYCRDVEVKRAIERHEAGTARVIPVILRPVDWYAAPFGKFQALPRDGKPVTSWKNRDAAMTDVAKGIREAVSSLGASGRWHPAHSSPASDPSSRTLGNIHAIHKDEYEDRELPLDPNLLALLNIEKARCRDRNVAFFTPNLLLALLGPTTGIARRLLDRACPGSAESIVRSLRQYEPFDGSVRVPFTDFEWRDRDDVRAASRRAKQDGYAAIDSRHLLLGFLDVDSQTHNELRQALGDDGLARFSKAAATPEISVTPGIRGLFTNSQRLDDV